MNKEQKILLWRIIVSSVLTAAGYILTLSGVPIYFYLPVFLLACIIAGYSVFAEAAENLFSGHILDENFLMTIGAAGAFILGDYSEGTVIMILFGLGEFFEEMAAEKSRKSIKELAELKAEYANLYKDGKLEKIEPEKLEVTNEICILAGEKVPADCIIVSGASDINTSFLTGESLPKSVGAGDTLLAGFINMNGDLICRVTKKYTESAAFGILKLIEDAAESKTKTENFVTKFAKYYTPIVVALALIIFAVPSIITKELAVWGYRAIMFLVVSCPCALVVSVPLSFFGAIGGASKIGILIKGGKYIEALSKVKIFAFDKTGTLTNGKFTVNEISPKDCSEEELLKAAAICEYRSNHPIALSIKEKYDASSFADKITEQKTLPGKGAVCICGGKTLLAGNLKLMEEYGIFPDFTEESGTVIYVAQDGEYLGSLKIGDTVKPDCAESIKALKNIGIKTAMLTGDNKAIAEKTAEVAGIEMVFAELLPNEKTEKLISLKSGGITAYAGDGINDAPVLAAADIGFSMGKLGSDAAIEVSDIVIMNDDLSLLYKAVKISKKAMRTVKENIAVSLLIKFAVLLLAAIGISNIYMAVFADVGVLILAILNALRNLMVK